MTTVAATTVTATGQPRPAPVAPKPARSVDPVHNPHRWTVPDAACIASQLPVASDADKARFKVVADLVQSRLYVVDKTTGDPVDAFLTSPGTDRYPTQGERFTITRTMPMAWWNPPNSDWAKNAKPAPPGPENPMGVLKFNLGAYGQYIHGIPKAEEKELGHHASHGCLRMSNGNVVMLYQRYVTTGTVVEVNRDAVFSQAMASRFAAAGRQVHRVSDGRENVQAVVQACGPNR